MEEMGELQSDFTIFGTVAEFTNSTDQGKVGELKKPLQFPGPHLWYQIESRLFPR